LLRNLEVPDSGQNPFSSFSSTIFQVLNFISSDYGALEPFQTSSAGVRTLRSLYIIVITILFLNTLIAMLNLKMAKADQRAANLYYLQTASLQVEIELGMLSSAERARRDWFPEWFSYSMTETEKQVWRDYVKRNPLKWTQENDFGEDKDHNPPTPPVLSETQRDEDVGSINNNDKVNDNKDVPPSAASATVDADEDKPSPNTATKAQKNGKAPANVDDTEAKAASAAKDEPFDEEYSAKLKEATKSIVESEKTASLTDEERSRILHACGICSKPGSMCKGCSLIAYCGKEHQKADWPRHKAECKKAREMDGRA
jgi:hypothetical protein